MGEKRWLGFVLVGQSGFGFLARVGERRSLRGVKDMCMMGAMLLIVLSQVLWWQVWQIFGNCYSHH